LNSDNQPDVEEARLDVAISFLARDEQTAVALVDLIADSLQVFFFPRRQEELAGTDGLESMRDPFLNARVVVVLYRAPWGETPWTRVEQTAITDRFLRDGWDWLLFVQLDDSPLPKWLPTTHVRFALQQYGLDQLVGAIKGRVQQVGGRITPPTALGRARQVQAEDNRRADQENAFRDTRWINDVLHPQLEALMASIRDRATEIARELGMGFVALAEAKRSILRDQRVSLNVSWRQQYTNVVDDRTNSGLLMCRFNGPVFLQSERLMSVMPPKEIGRRLFMPQLSLSRDVVWKEDRKNHPPLPIQDLADVAVTDFIDLIDRTNRGGVDLNFF
jgi:hypothetical protein